MGVDTFWPRFRAAFSARFWGHILGPKMRPKSDPKIGPKNGRETVTTFRSGFRVHEMVTKMEPKLDEQAARAPFGAAGPQTGSTGGGVHFVSKKCPLVFGDFRVSLGPGAPGALYGDGRKIMIKPVISCTCGRGP